MGVENFYIQKGSTESASQDFTCLDVKSSVIFSSGCFNVRAFAFQRLKFRLYFNIKAYFVQECRKNIAKYPPLAQCREWVTANDCPHGHVCGMYGGSHPYLRCNQPLNSHLLRKKLYFCRGSTLSKFNAPFCDARLLVSFFF